MKSSAVDAVTCYDDCGRKKSCHVSTMRSKMETKKLQGCCKNNSKLLPQLREKVY